MAFTISHVAVVLPFVRHRIIGLNESARKGLTTGLVIGSMVCDFEKFAPIRRSYFLQAALLHRPPTMIKYGILISLITAALVELLTPTVARILGFRPTADQTKFFPRTPLAGLLFVVGVISASFSHIAIDQITHTDNLFAYRSRYLMRPIPLGFTERPLATVLWWVSSIVGALVVLIWLFVRRNRISRTRPNIDALAFICGTSLLVGSAFGYQKSFDYGRYAILKYTFLGSVAMATVWIVAFACWELIRGVPERTGPKA